MNRSPIANRSFLHGNQNPGTCSDKLVYATLDSLALKRTRLPLQLLPTDNEIESVAVTAATAATLKQGGNRTISSKCEEPLIHKQHALDREEAENSIYSKVVCTSNGTIATIRICAPELQQQLLIANVASYKNEKDSPAIGGLYDQVEAKPAIPDRHRNRAEPAGLAEDSLMLAATEKQLRSQSEETKSKHMLACPKKKKHFAKKVLGGYFSGSQLVKRPKKKRRRKQRQESSGSGSPLSNRVRSEANDGQATSKGKKRSETRQSISSPTNFVHVASATLPNLAASHESTFSWPALDRVVITYKEKCATLPPLNRRTEARSFLSGPPLHTHCQSKLKVNSSKLARSKSSVFNGGTSEAFVNPSFLLSSRSKGILPSRESAEHTSQTDNEADSSTEQYDDVFPTTSPTPIPTSLPQSEEYMYDDVGLSNTEPLHSGADDSTDETYDDVIIIRHPAIKTPSEGDGVQLPAESTENQYSSVEEIGKPLHRVKSLTTNRIAQLNNHTGTLEDDEHPLYDDVGFPKLAEERVNSLYYSGSMRTFNSTNNKESEWEDVSTSSGASSDNNLWKSTEVQRGANKKKPGQVLRACKAMRHRSKRSSRSNQSFRGKSLDRADFLGEEDASDGSNYESVSSLQSEKETLMSEFELKEKTTTKSNVEVSSEEVLNRNEVAPKLEAPTKPVPPPPREASLTESLGKRIKMLRRTWSITKGSIGRIRRRTSVEVENPCEDGRYFGLARHFRKSTPTSQTSNANSRFYLERAALPNNTSLDATSAIHAQYHLEDKSSEEGPYVNWNRYEHVAGGLRPVSTTPSEMILDNIDHYSVFSDQEPLYQFYAAAAARFAYDSPSEISENENENENENVNTHSYDYEEVRGVVPSKATTELAKPGHRTLWSQTPQIINSGLLQSLTPDEIKIQEAKFEILTSEASYLNSLRVLEKEFLGDLVLTEQILSPIEREQLFGSVPYVVQTSEKFLADLESVWRTDPTLRLLPDVLLNHAHTYSDAYVTYCSKQVAIDATFKDLRARKGSKFLDALARIEARASCHSLSLHSFLMLPMQRITRLPLLADAILSKLPMDQSAEKRSWENVLSTFSHIVVECNEAARAAAQEAEIEQLTRRLEYPMKIPPIVLKGKFLIKSGQVVQFLTKVDAEYKLTFGKKFNKLPLFLFLLTDYLLITKRKTNTSQEEVYLVVDMCKRNLVALERAPEDGVIAGAKNAMLMTLLENYCGQQVNYLLTCESNTERERWLEAVCPCEHGLIGETLYEAWDCPQVVALYSYSPCQPDELHLQPGDVINVLKKMPDGWYQGEKLLSGEQGWFPENYTKEVASEHVRARNLKQRHRLLTLSGKNSFSRSVK